MAEHPAPFGPQYGFGLYVHWPYCSKICPYCDFNVYAAKARSAEPLLKAISDDIRIHRPRMPEHGALDTVYFGGGTPSLLKPGEVAGLLATAEEVFGIKPGAEITLEANPNDVLRADLRGLKAAGVTRLSIGVQSLRDNALAFLGRDHDAVSARAAVERALHIFPNASIDFIYARPSQSIDEWGDELGEALALGAPHLSLYELTIEQRTAFGKAVSRGELVPMDPDAQADLYELTQTITTRAGLPAYEVSNHAAGPEFRSRHNQIYWHGGDWIGVGPGAHGRVSVGGKRYASEAEKRPEAYIANVVALGSGWGQASTLYPLDIARELIAMGLRDIKGIDVQRIEAMSNTPVPRDRIEAFIAEGWVRFDGTTLSLTPAGWLLADAITSQLAP